MLAAASAAEDDRNVRRFNESMRVLRYTSGHVYFHGQITALNVYMRFDFDLTLWRGAHEKRRFVFAPRESRRNRAAIDRQAVNPSASESSSEVLEASGARAYKSSGATRGTAKPVISLCRHLR